MSGEHVGSQKNVLRGVPLPMLENMIKSRVSTLYSNNTAGKKVMNPLPSAQCTHAQLSAWLAHCIPCDEVRITQRAQRTSQSLANKPKPSQPGQSERAILIARSSILQVPPCKIACMHPTRPRAALSASLASRQALKMLPAKIKKTTTAKTTAWKIGPT